MSRKMIAVLLSMILLSALVVSCKGGGNANSEAGVSSEGQAVQVKDAMITLNKGSIDRNKILANFTVENKGSSDLTIDPATSFTITADNQGENVAVEVDPIDCKSTELPKTIKPGENATGDVCWRSDPTLTWPAAATIKFDTATWKLKGEE
jgi:hypothetical protein